VKESILFPKAVDYHKPDKPLVANGLGVLYVLVSTVYLFSLHFLGVYARASLALAVCILFGGFLGLLDDWLDLKWRYKAFFPLFVALPLAALPEVDTVMATYIFGRIDFQIYFYVVIIPLIVTVTTNTVNQLGGLNGLETVCPLVVMVGLMMVSAEGVLLYLPIVAYFVLACFNFGGKIFVGNTGSFAAGITLASYAVIANNEQTLLISLLPFVFNSSLILLNRLFFRRRASMFTRQGVLYANHRRSLVTLIAHYRPSKERELVAIVALIVGSFVVLAGLAWWLF
jgi:UDP-N-acetylglucosamine--dolichyl-phosphate N-acetylglucosaminephosphotransferase